MEPKLSRNVGNRLYHSTPRKTPEDFWSHLHRGGSLKSRKKYDGVTHTKTNKKLIRRAVYGSCIAALNWLVPLTAEIILSLTM